MELRASPARAGHRRGSLAEVIDLPPIVRPCSPCVVMPWSVRYPRHAASGGRQLPKVETMLRDAAEDLLAFTAFPVAHGRRSGRPTRWNDSTKRPNAAPASPACSPTPTPCSGWRRARRGPRRMANRGSPLPRRRIHGPAHHATSHDQRTPRRIIRRVVSPTTNRKTEHRTEPHAGDEHPATGGDPSLRAVSIPARLARPCSASETCAPCRGSSNGLEPILVSKYRSRHFLHACNSACCQRYAAAG